MKLSIAFLSTALAASALARPSTLSERVQQRADGTRRHRTQPLVKVGSGLKENAKSISSSGNNTAHVQYSSNWSGAVLESRTTEEGEVFHRAELPIIVFKNYYR